MKAQVYINRHVVAANKKATKDHSVPIDEAAISVNTYLLEFRLKKRERQPK